jgi:hypothetical protein
MPHPACSASTAGTEADSAAASIGGAPARPTEAARDRRPCAPIARVFTTTVQKVLAPGPPHERQAGGEHATLPLSPVPLGEASNDLSCVAAPGSGFEPQRRSREYR